MEELKLFINAFKSEQPENCISVFFSRRITSNDISKYSTHQPSVSPQVQNDILRTVLPNIENQLASYQIVEYNPVGVLDGSLEKLSLTEIPCLIHLKKACSLRTFFGI